MPQSKKVNVNNIQVEVFSKNEDDFISLTDIARSKNPNEPKDVVKNWLRSRSTIEFLGLWEQINNPDFKGVEFDSFKYEAGSNSFTLSPQKWIETTNSIGLISKSGRYGGGTYAHKDIAFEFASWISAEFKLYLIKEFQRLKEDENKRLATGWDAKRQLTKINYRIHTDSVQRNLIPDTISTKQATITYASEADVLNKALYGMTAKEWKELNPDKEGNIRDYSTVEQLICLANLETLNAHLIDQKMVQGERLTLLNKIAQEQMKSISGNSSVKKLKVNSEKYDYS